MMRELSLGRQLGYKSRRYPVETLSLAKVMQVGEDTTEGEMARIITMYLKCHEKVQMLA